MKIFVKLVKIEENFYETLLRVVILHEIRFILHKMHIKCKIKCETDVEYTEDRFVVTKIYPIETTSKGEITKYEAYIFQIIYEYLS